MMTGGCDNARNRDLRPPHGYRSSVLVAKLSDQGDLTLEGHDLGLTTEEFWSDSDYEYFRTVQAADVPAVLLHLMKERFQSDSEFKQWLVAKGIESKLTVGDS